jgi:uncharacterized RDD family membrane protein YckC
MAEPTASANGAAPAESAPRASVAARLAGATGLERAIAGVVEETIVRTVESDAVIQAIERIIVDGRLQAAIERSIDDEKLEEAIKRAIESQVADRVWEDILASGKAQMLVERIAEAPEIRAAVAAQGFGLITDFGRQVGHLTMKLDHALERVARSLARKPHRVGETDRAGLATRGVAAAVDGGILFGAAALVGTIFTSLTSIDSIGDFSTLALVGVIFLYSWAAASYFGGFWALEGQTPGMRFIGIRLEWRGTPRIGQKRATRRLVGLVLAIIPFGLGLIGILFSDRRRGLHDRMADTDVVRDAEHTLAPWAVNDVPGQPG